MGLQPKKFPQSSGSWAVLGSEVPGKGDDLQEPLSAPTPCSVVDWGGGQPVGGVGWGAAAGWGVLPQLHSHRTPERCICWATRSLWIGTQSSIGHSSEIPPTGDFPLALRSCS